MYSSNMGVNYPRTFQILESQLLNMENQGEVADYIPSLKSIDPDKFGLFLYTLKQGEYAFGDCEEQFSIQSIAKVFSLVLAYQLEDDRIWERLNVEPSGNPFNSLVQLETEHGKPRNPFINAGALVVCDILVSHLENPMVDLLNFIRKATALPLLQYNLADAKLERETAFRNYSLLNLMKDCGNIFNDVEEVIELYVHLCSIEMNCMELAQGFLFLANQGINPINDACILDAQKTKRVNAVMQLCGLYDEAGEYAFRVGLPGKSGVGGGIVAVHPGHYSVAVWSPKLNIKGNSYRGLKVLEELTSQTSLSIF